MGEGTASCDERLTSREQKQERKSVQGRARGGRVALVPHSRRHLPDFSPGELEILRPRDRLGLVDWVSRHRWITAGPLIDETGQPVRWSHETFPPQEGIARAIDDPRWSLVVVMGPPQAAGKTDVAAVNVILHRLFELNVDALYMSANALKAHDQWHKKFLPAILASPEIRGQIPEDRDRQGTKDRRDFVNGRSLFLAGAESVANISGSTIPVVICDDVQAMPATIGAHGHPVDVARKRSGALPERMVTHVALGTAGAEGDFLDREMNRGAGFRPQVPCLECGTYQEISWDRMQFDQADAVRAHADVWMRCADAGCAHQIRDFELPAMLRRYQWVARGQHVGPDGTVVGELPATRTASYWLSALYWPFTSWGKYAAEWVESRGDPDKEKDFQQHVLVIPWKEPDVDENAMLPEEVAEHAEPEHRKGVIPDAADVITLTADVMDAFLYYELSAWNRKTGDCWLVDAGTIGVHGPRKGENLDARELQARIESGVRRALEDLWAYAIGLPRRVSLALIDAGHRPDAVTQFCRLRGLKVWRPIRGRTRTHGVTRIWSGEPKTDKKARAWWEIGVDEAKHVLREILRVPRGRPGYFHLYEDKSLAKYHRHLSSEQWVSVESAGQERQRWEKRPGAGPNHWLDCRVYAIAAAIACGVRMPGMVPADKKPPRVPAETKRESERRPIRAPLLQRAPIRRNY